MGACGCGGLTGGGLRGGVRPLDVLGVCKAIDQGRKVGKAGVLCEEFAFGGLELGDLGVEFCQSLFRGGKGAVDTRRPLRVGCDGNRGGAECGGCGGGHARVVPLPPWNEKA